MNFLFFSLSSSSTSLTIISGTNNTSLLSSIDIESSSSLLSTQHKLRHIHQCMGHLNINKIQEFAWAGIFGQSLQTIGSCNISLCKSCLYGKQHRFATASTIVALHLSPGDCVSGDQVESFCTRSHTYLPQHSNYRLLPCRYFIHRPRQPVSSFYFSYIYQGGGGGEGEKQSQWNISLSFLLPVSTSTTKMELPNVIFGQ